ncbi:NADH-quinone oxidoreductase subunit NuoE [Buchnera aphidicola (Hormaphis cornu)]|nr:NADH-quinone oxidoreductase subunit NuoE [Buchnera aphidicola (Hormaphis cornu)]
MELKKKSYKNSRAASIEALKIVQKRLGWISKQSMVSIAKILNLPVAEIESIATFYSQIFRKPVGENIIKYCDSMVCYIMGYKEIKQSLFKILNIRSGETTVDRKFTLLPVCCLGNCDKAPTIMINEDLFSNVTPKSILCILESYK